MKENICVLMLAGNKPTGLGLAALNALLPLQPYIIAADGGARHLAALGIAPHLLVGDGDSADEDTLSFCRSKGIIFNPLPREKDFTDGEAALVAAIEHGYTHLAVFGALGGNLDHQLGNLLLPLAYRDKWQSLSFYGEDCRAFYSFGSSTVKGTAGDTVSLLPLSPAVTGLSLSGFKYPLKEAQTSLGNSLCLRNQLSACQGQVEFSSGIVLIIHYPQI